MATITYDFRPLLPGKQGTEQTLAEMAKIVRRDSVDPGIVALARRIVSAVKPHDEKAEIEAVYDYVKKAIRYVQDPADAEWIQDTRRSLILGSGDCDDKATALASLLGAIGYVCRFAVCGYESDPLSQFDHVWVQALFGDKWIDLDASEDEYVGWRTNGFSRLGVYQIFGGETMPLGRGLGDDFSDLSFTDYSGEGDPFTDFGFDSTDTTTTNFDGFDSLTGEFDFGDFSDSSSVYDPNNDPNVLSSEDSALFDYLQQNFGYQGSTIDQFSLQDIGIFPSADGSYVQINQDGTLSFHNADGSINAPVTDNSGMPISAAGLAPSAIKQVAQAAANHVAQSGGSGGGGGGIPIGNAPKPQTPAASQTDSISKTINSITNAIKNALGVTNAAGLTHANLPYNGINPLTGRAYANNSLYTSPQGAGISLSTSTLLLIGLAFLAFRK